MQGWHAPTAAGDNAAGTWQAGGDDEEGSSGSSDDGNLQVNCQSLPTCTADTIHMLT